MTPMTLTPVQRDAVAAGGTSYLYGPAGTGKTTALQQRLLRLLREGEPAYTILVLVAEPEHRDAFFDTLHTSGLGPYAELNVTHYTRLAQSMVSLFWPLVARGAGFARPYQPPTFLSYDLAQVLMWRV
ncbi:MAG TPA: UvrD-helicase domain-containing protein, partial [Promineifilum sp.]|nr:UvrD-helicase domain-containing protein [Promineifilum sp.]